MIIGCPNQAATEEFTAAAFGPIYPTSDSVGVQFSTSDADLQRSYDHAIQCELGNGKEFLPGLVNVVEGAGYGNVWLETQPYVGFTPVPDSAARSPHGMQLLCEIAKPLKRKF
jgi:hypothetical protein